MLRLRSLGSGSTGNATVVEACGRRKRRLLVDCGLGPKVLQARLAQAGLELSDIDALFITHEHHDHMAHAHRTAMRHRIPVWMSEGSWRAGGQADYGDLLRLCTDSQPIDLGEMELMPIAVPHDAQEPLQLRCSDGRHQIGILTDLGHVPEGLAQRLSDCQLLLLECNHDPQLLSQSAYPEFLKRRISGALGHLSNEQAGRLAAALQGGALQHVVAAHLSRTSNRPELASQTLQNAVAGWAQVSVADAVTGTAWIGPEGA